MKANDGKAPNVAKALAVFANAKAGASAIEYTLLMALVALVIVVGAGLLGASLYDAFLMFGTLPAWDN